MVGIRDLKQNASEVMARVKRGESVLVTDRGRPVGRIVPLTSSPIDDLVEAGALSEPTESFDEVLHRAMKAESSMESSADILDELREERL